MSFPQLLLWLRQIENLILWELSLCAQATYHSSHTGESLVLQVHCLLSFSHCLHCWNRGVYAWAKGMEQRFSCWHGVSPVKVCFPLLLLAVLLQVMSSKRSAKGHHHSPLPRKKPEVRVVSSDKSVDQGPGFPLSKTIRAWLCLVIMKELHKINCFH